MPDVPLVTVTLLNVAFESFLYGVFFVLNAGSFVLMIYPRHETPSAPRTSLSRRFKTVLRQPMFIGATFLFIGVTGHWVTTILRMLAALTNYKEGMAPVGYYVDISQNIYSIKTAFIAVGVIAADTMLIYRLWLVYGKNHYVVAAPLSTLFGLTICSFGIVNEFAHYPSGLSIFSPKTKAWVVSDGVFTLVTNVYSTAMIAWRIFWTERQSQSAGARVTGSTSLKSILVTFIESALLYTAWTIVFIATFAAESHVEAMMADCWAVIAGISFGLINVGIGMGWAKTSSAASPSTFTFHRFRISESRQTTMDETPQPMQTLVVHVHQVKNTTQSLPEVVSFPTRNNNHDRDSTYSG